MRVGVNTIGMKPGHGGGEEHYLRNVMATIRREQPDIEFVLFTEPDNHDAFEGYSREPIEGGFLNLSGIEGQLDHTVRRAHIDALFTPLRTALTKCPVPQVIFALDLFAMEKLPIRLPHREASRFKTLKRICRDAAAIVAPSQYLQRRFLELLDVPLDKIAIAPLGVSELFLEAHSPIVEPPFWLAVGSTREYRNIPRLLQASETLREDFPHTLVIVGQPEEAELEEWGEGIVRVDRCPTQHLAGLYQHCDVFICASLYEGSGVAVLEAMRSGAPVATSRVGGIPEVAGDVPVFFNPENVGTIAGAIRRLLEENPEDHKRRLRFGRQIAGEYTWQTCAWKTVGALRRA